MPGGSAALQAQVFTSFITEINALKPGNVSRYCAGHGMDYADFYRSAELVSPILCERRLSMGERLLRAVRLTRAEVGCNTNLGMLLLFLPIIRLREQHVRCPLDSQGLRRIVAAVRAPESALFFAAIRLARPGGLGAAPYYDVNEKPAVSLLTAMRAAAGRDLIAAQYCNGYAHALDFGLVCLHDYVRRWNSVEWAAVGCYLRYLAQLDDSHISRKFGRRVAQQTRTRAAAALAEFDGLGRPQQAVDMLLAFDAELKGKHINPGACADLTAATLLLYQLGCEH